jgi:hypothetical protein
VVESSMTAEERADILSRLMAMQHALRTVCESAEAYARVAAAADGNGLAFATLMMKEAISGFSLELNKFVLGMLDDDKS